MVNHNSGSALVVADALDRLRLHDIGQVKSEPLVGLRVRIDVHLDALLDAHVDVVRVDAVHDGGRVSRLARGAHDDLDVAHTGVVELDDLRARKCTVG